MTFARRVVSGSSQLTIGNGLVRLLAIVTMPILTGLLSPHVYGVAVLAGTIISLASVLALAGMDTSYLRAYPSAQPPNGVGAEHYCWRIAVGSAVLTGALAALGWYLLGGGSIESERELAILIGIGVVLSVLSTMAQVRALLAGRHRAMALSIVGTGIVAAALSVALAVWRQDALALLIPLVLGYLIPILLLGTPPLLMLMKRSGLKRSEGLAIVKIGLAGIVTAPMYWLLSSSDRWFLERYHGAESVGVYSIGYSVAIIGMMVNTAIMTVWQPEAAREYEKDPARAPDTLGRVMSRLVAAMAIIWLAAAAAGGDIVRWLANERFHAAAGYVSYIAGGVFFYGLLRLATTGLLLARQLQWSAFWWLTGGLVCSALNLALVPRYGGPGAAATQCISFAVIAVGIFATAQTKFRVHLDWGRLVAVMLVVVAAGAFLDRPWHPTPYFSLLAKFPVGMVVAAVVAWIAAPDWCAYGVAHLRRRVFR
jgi:O-antigen/teichoic acid export membrane protein